MVAGVNCFPCFTCQKSNKESHSKREHGTTTHDQNVTAKPPDMKKQRPEETAQVDASDISVKHYTFRELATATKNFRQECLLGEGGFGRVYRGIIPATGQAVAVKQLDRNGMNGVKEFLAEVHTLSALHHENLVNLVGYCADGDQRLLVYEFVPGATLEDHLLASKEDQPPLDWFTRMKVAAGAARGLEYLHDSANPPIIFRDLKPSDILLDGDDHRAKLFDFGMSHGGGDKANPAPPRVMGTYGYCAPEYVRTGQLTLKSDVYSFGVVLLELITGRRAVDTTRPNEEQNLVSWAQPLFRDPKRYPDMADPNLNKDFPEKDLNQAVAIAAMCLQEEAEARPLMSDVVTALSFLSVLPPPAAALPRSELSDGEGDRGGGESGSETGSEYEYYSKGGSRRGSNSVRSSSSYSGSESESFSSYSTNGAASRKASGRSSRKSTMREMGEKISSMKNSVRVLTHKRSDGAPLSRNSSRASRGDISFGLTSSSSTSSSSSSRSGGEVATSVKSR